eukprot:TRINITY_DN27880_c0_g1_i1.p1 TRINITY_DN27880_c0_g1~~TRINITY_DN27880_c0_g1_i1.p1  ORF type:complete len:278 (+),score=28.60 TRINITY_DN27880_c0_g1_i1:38-835(+)
MKWWVASLAGGISGGVEAVLTYPAEYSKTRMQLSDKKGPGMIHVLKETARVDGIKGWYRGVGIVVCGGIPKHGLRFGVHDFYVKHIGSPASPWSGFIGGLSGGIAASLFAIIPQETIKTTMIHNKTNTKETLRHLYSTGGVFSFYKGVLPTVTKNGLNTAIRIPLQGYIKSHCPQTSSAAAEAATHSAAGIASGWVSVLFTQPFDTIKTKVQRSGGTQLSKTIIDTYRQGGVAMFYTGTIPRLIRITPENAILFAVFPVVKKHLE